MLRCNEGAFTQGQTKSPVIVCVFHRTRTVHHNFSLWHVCSENMFKKKQKKKTDMQNKAKHPKNLNQEHGCRTGNRVHHCTECKQQNSRDKESDTKRFPLLKNCD